MKLNNIVSELEFEKIDLSQKNSELQSLNWVLQKEKKRVTEGIDDNNTNISVSLWRNRGGKLKIVVPVYY